jgi:hypothetical protein
MVCFQTKNPNLGQKFWYLRLENVDIFNGHLEYFMDISDILRKFGTFCVRFVHFFPVWASRTKKNLATLLVISILKCFGRFFYHKRIGSPWLLMTQNIHFGDEVTGQFGLLDKQTKANSLVF